MGEMHQGKGLGSSLQKGSKLNKVISVLMSVIMVASFTNLSGFSSLAGAATMDSDQGQSTGDSSTTDESAVVEQHQAVNADLPVKLTFALDGSTTTPVDVTIQLQKRTATWDSATSTWSEYGSWSNVDGEAVALSAADLATTITADSQYTYQDLPVQTVTDEGSYSGRAQYRAIETMVDGATLGEYSAQDSNGFMTATAAAGQTTANTSDYVVTVSGKAGLLIDPASETDAVTSELSTGSDKTIANTATSIPVVVPVTETESISPQADGDHTVTYKANGSVVSQLTATVADGQTATAPTNDQIQNYVNTATCTFGTDGAWVTDAGTAYDFSTPVTTDITLTARYGQIGTYTVTNTTHNYGASDVTIYKLSKAATVTVNGGTATQYAAGDPISVPANGSMSIVFSSTTDDLVVTLDTAATATANSAACTALSATTATLGTTGGTTTTTATFSTEEPVDNINLLKNWEDGSAAVKPEISLYLQYSLDSGDSWNNVTTANMTSLGLTEVPTVPDKNAALSNNTVSVYSFDKKLNDLTIDGTPVIYRLGEAAVAGYVSSYADTGNTTLVNTKLDPLEATKSWADGLNKYGTRVDVATWLSKVTCTRSSLYTENATITLTTTDTNAEGYVQVTDNGDGTWTIMMPNTRGYDSYDAPYVYALSEAASITPASTQNVTSTTVYVPTYENTGDYATHTDALFDGGTVTNTLTDTELFTASKSWKDDNSAESIAARPTSTVELYRYPDDGTSSYVDASPVAGATTTSLSNTATSAFGFTLPTDGGKLPTYNEAGYKYIYFAKEHLSGGTNSYEQKFTSNGDYPGNDMFVFSGGEIDNTITGTVSLSATKTWVAANRQDVDAKVTVSVTQTDPDKLASDPDKSVVVATQELTGFGTENPSKTADFSGLPKYNSNGHKYTYKLSENSVQTMVNGTFEDATIETEGNTTYIITADGYRYRQDSVTDEATGKTTLTNTLVGNAQVTVNKTFSDGLLADPTTSTFTIYQNGTAIGTKTVTYTGSTAVPYTPPATTITSYEDMDAGSYSGSGLLPRYDANGVQYKYTVEETNIASTATYGHSTSNSMGEGTYPETDTNYAGEKYSLATANIANSKPSEGMSILVHKSWGDAGESLYRLPVHLELQYTADGTNWTTVNTGTIDTSTDYVYIDVPNSVPTGSTTTDTWRTLYTAWVTAGQHAGVAGSFRVVETALGDNAVVADSAVNTTTNPEHESGWSFVTTTNQNYDVSPTATVNSTYDYTVTNKRVGVEKIVLSKAWVDGSNAQGTRPDSVTFTVTASENVFDGGTSATKTFTLTAADANPENANEWDLDTGWLQKYDATTGVYISYTIAETSLNYTDTTKASNADLYARSSKHVSYVVPTNHTGDIDTYAFSNSLSGSVTPLMNKYWKDLGDSTTILARPDIYPVLIRSYTDGTGTTHYEKMGYTDRDWNTREVNDNWWQCTFVPQSRYTSDGYEYTYYVAEEYTSAIHDDYVCSGGYTNSPDPTAGTFTEDTANLDKLDAGVTGLGKDYYVARLNNVTGAAGTVVNKPVATRTISGTKVWNNMPSSFKKINLPDVTFQLYRYLSTQTQADATLVTTDGSADPTKAVTATLESGATAFKFSSDVDRYNSDGIPYVYIVKETAPANMNLAYTITNDTEKGLVVTNDFKSIQNYGITFNKTWPGTPTGLSDTQKPTSTITLSRYLTSATTSSSGETTYTAIAGTRESDFATAAANTNANTVTITSDTTSVSWSALAYYGPNGNPYEYRIEESDVPDGYVVYDAAGQNVVTATTIGDTTAYEAVVSGSYDGNTGEGAAGLTDKYGEVLGALDVAKIWPDTDAYAVSPKPSSVTFKLWRWSQTQTTPTQVGDAITVSSTDTAGTYTSWAKEISNLEIYDPHGEPYSYIVTEGEDSTLAAGTSASAVTGSTAPTGYTVSGITGAVSAVGGTAAKQTTAVTNTLTTKSMPVTKEWDYLFIGDYQSTLTPAYGDLLFASTLNGTPTKITYRFQYTVDGGTTWSMLNDENGNAVEKSVDLDGTGNGYASTTLGNLPSYILVNGVAKAASYRAVEYSLTYKNGTVYKGAIPTGNTNETTIGAVDGSAGTTLDSTAFINSSTMREITVSKSWDDENNRDGVRPSSVEFTITRNNIDTVGDSASEKVTLTAADTNGDPNVWETTYFVPVYWNVDTTTMSTYKVEETTVGSGYTTYAGTSENPTTVGSSVTLPGYVNPVATYFKNSRTHSTFQLTPKKIWSYEGTTYNGTTNLPTLLQSYIPSSIEFTLQAEALNKDNSVKTAWADIDSTAFGTDFSGIAKTKTTTAINGTTGAITVGNWTGLPRYASDSDVTNLVTYHYRVVEKLDSDSNVYAISYDTSDLNGATADATTASIATTNTLDRSTLAITKAWSDQNNNCNTRPDKIKYTVQYSTDGTTWTNVPDSWTNGKTSGSVVTVTPTNKNTDGAYNTTLDSLPKYAPDGTTEYEYKAVETALVYGTTDVAPGAGPSDSKPYYVSSITSSSTAGSTTTYTTAFTNSLVYTKFTVVKKWVDSTPGIVSQVGSVRYYMQQSIDNTNWSYVLGSDGTTKDFWTLSTNGSSSDISKTMDSLPKYDPQGNLYYYRGIEDLIVVGGSLVNASNTGAADPTSGTVGGFTYTSTATATATTTITNTATTTSVSASKTWSDNNNANGERPSSIKFHLKQGSTVLTPAATFDKTLTSGDSWAAATWSNLPKQNAAGTAYTYTVTEDTVPGYTTAITGTQAGGYTVTNTAIPVTISKVASNGTTKLAGATFTLKGTFTNGTAEETKTWTSTNDSVWDLTGLLVQGNVYTLTETVPPTGYTLPATTTTYLKVDASGKLYTGTTAASQTTAVTGNALAISDAPTKVKLTKTDASGNALSGATFTITGTFVDANDQTQQTAANTVITTDANPFSLEGRLIAGNTCTIAETAAPEGYLTMQTSFMVTMGADGKLTAGTLPAGVNASIGYDTTNSTATITIADEPTAFTASKYASTDTAKATPIAGTVFTVTPSGSATFVDGSTTPLTFTSTTGTQTGLTGKLKTDTEYTIQETTPTPGYELPSPNPVRTIRITNAGQLQENINGTWTDVASNALAFFDAKTDLKIVKQDNATNAQIGGSTYTLTGKFVGDTTATTQTLSPTATTAAELSTKMVADNTTTYTLTETTPAPGYLVSRMEYSYNDADPFNGYTMTLKMDTYGQLYYKTDAGDDTWAAVSSNELVLKDVQSLIMLDKHAKKDGDILTTLPATFTITGVFVDSNGASATKTLLNNATTGSLSGQLIAGQTYTIKETGSPSGFYAAGDCTFTFNNDGSVTGNLPEGYWLGYDSDGNPGYVVTDYQTNVKLTKTDDATPAANLSGAEFTITGTFQDGSTSKTWNTTTDNATTITGQFIVGNTYAFSETTVPYGYEKTPDFSVKMRADGYLDAIGTQPSNVKLSGNTGTGGQPTIATVTIANTQNSITLAKVDVGSVDPAAATFTIEGLFSTSSTTTANETRTYTASAPGSATITGEMVAGQTYTVTETIPPSGYKTIASTFQVAMGSDGTVSAVGSLPSGVTISADGLTITVDDEQNSFTLTKNGANGALAGAVFTLTDTSGANLADNQSSYQFTTATSASTITGKMIASTTGTTHTYKLEETTPASGYTITTQSPVYLRIDTAGNLSSCTTADGTFSPVAGNAITMTDAQNNVSLTKTNADGTQTLTGATFTIAPASGKTFADGSTAAKTLPSDGTLFTGELISGVTYTITETVPPAGYSIPQNPLTFTATMDNYGALTVVGGTGYVSVTNAATAENPGGTAAITVKDTQNTLSITKTGADGNLAGATFSLSGTFATNGAADAAASTIEWTTAAADPTNNPYTLTGKLVAGNVYKLSETTPGLGYTNVADTYLKMDAYGQLWSDTSATGAFTTEVTDNALTLADVQNKVSLSKVDANNAGLAGAVFSISGTFANGQTSRAWTSTTSAELLTGEMVAGNSYIFHETTAPEGYISIPDFTVTMGSDGKLTYTTLPSSATGTVTVSYANGTNTVTVKDVQKNLTLTKTDGKTPAADLTGSVFSITGIFAGGTQSETRTLHSDSVNTFAGQLVAGRTYTISETTPPQGYKSAADFQILVAADGASVSLVGDARDDVSISGMSITVSDSQNSVDITKVESDGTTLLAGAQFTLTGTFTDSATSKSWTSTSSAPTSATDGLFTGLLIAGQQYQLTEATPAPGHKISSFTDTYSDASLAGSALVVRVTNAGQLQYKTTAGTDTWSDITNNGVAMKDAKNVFTLAKKDEANNPAVATFTIAGEFVSGTTSPMTVTTDSTAGKVAVEGKMIAGKTYTVTETVPPEGHKVITSSFDITMNADGSITYGTLPAGVSIDGATATATVSNTENTLTISKLDQFNRTVPGATMQITGTFAGGSTSPITWETSDGVPTNNPYTITGKLVAGNEYTISETTTPDGYITADSQVIRMTAAGQLEVRGGQAGAYTWTSVPQNTISITDPLSLTQAKVTKTGTDGVALEGCTFTLYKMAGATPSATDETIATGITPTIAAGTTEASWSTAAVAAGVTNPDTGEDLNLGLANGTYYLVEQSCPDNYYLDTTPHSFTVDNSTNATTVTVPITNVEMNAQMTLTKLDAISKAAVPGTQFTLYYYKNGNTTTTPDQTTVLETGTDGTITATSLDVGSYFLNETRANANYKGSMGFRFVVTSQCQDQTLTINSTSLGTATPFNLTIDNGDEAMLTSQGVLNARKAGTLEIQKNGVDDDATGLDGVLFNVYKADGTFVYGARTADGGQFGVASLAWGDYYFVETEVPDGYKVDSTHHEFSIGYDNLDAAFTVDGKGAITNEKNEFTLEKYGLDLNSSASTAKTGSTFQITGIFAGKTASETRTILSGAQTQTLTGQLIGGNSYTVHELTPPQGYKTVSDFTITMNTDGTISLGAARDDVSVDGHTAKVTDPTNSLTISKLNEDSEAQTGATFTIAGVFVDSAGASTTETLLSSDASTMSMKGNLIAGNSYTIHETTPPQGYTCVSDFTVTMNADGTVTAGTLPEGVEVNGADASITVTDVQTSLSITKTTTEGEDLSGSTFQVTGTFAGGTASETREMSPNATAIWMGKLVVGNTYTVHEKTPPKGYKSTPDFTVTVGRDGTLTLGDASTLVTSTGTAVTVRDEQNSLSISKVDATTGQVVSKAGFELDGPSSIASESTYDWYSSDTPKTFTGVLVAGQECTLAETSPAPGYISSSFTVTYSDAVLQGTSLVIKMDEVGQLYYKSTAQGGWTAIEDNAIAMKDSQTVFNMDKVDTDDAVLTGATFEVTGIFVEGNGQTTTKTTTDQATSWVGQMIAGNTYSVHEATPPQGYKAVPDFQVTMGLDGTLSLTGASDAVKIANNTVYVADAQNSLTVEKDNEKGKTLGGVTFELRTTDAASTLVDGWTTEIDDNTGEDIDNPYTITGKLTAGVVYRLTETSPSFGYTVAADTFLKMDNAGQLWSDTSATGDFTTKVENNALVIANMPTSLSFTKLDADGTTQLADAYLTFTTVIGTNTLSFDVASLSDKPAVAIRSMAAGYEYTVSESMPAAGHLVSSWTDTYSDAALNSDGELIVKMENSGQLEYKTTAGTWTSITDNAIKMKDTQTSISIEKVDEQNAALAGAEFELSGVDGATFAHATEPLTWTSGTTAYTITGELSAGFVYKLTETTPAPGYTNAADVYLSIDSQGVLTKSNTDKGPWIVVGDSAETVLTVSDTQTDVTITKADAEGAALAGASFSLAGTFADGSTAPITWTSTDSAYDLTGKLVAGNVYQLTETNPAEGYTTAADVFLKVDNAGALWTDTSATGTFTTSVADNALVVNDVQNSFTFNKVGENSEPLTGATFKLTGTFADGTTSMDLFSGAETSNVTGKLIAGETYTLTETVMPAGFMAIDPITVTVSADGRRLSFSPTSDHLSVTDEANGATVTVTDDPIAIVVEKTDRTTGKQLPNHADCIFKVTPADGTTFADGSTTPIQGNDDRLTAALRGMLIGTQLDASGNVVGTRYTYTIQEVKEPGGYEIEPTVVQFIVDQKGKVYALNGEGTIITSAEGSDSLAFSDPIIAVGFEKTDASGNMIDGATLTVAGQFVDGSTSKTVSPTASAASMIDGQLVADTTYTLTETTTPSGYVALTSPITFTVDDLGSVTISSNPDNAASVSTDGKTILVKNTASTSASTIPKTGDDAPIAIVGLAGIVGLAACVYAASRRRRRRDED